MTTKTINAMDGARICASQGHDILAGGTWCKRCGAAWPATGNAEVSK